MHVTPGDLALHAVNGREALPHHSVSVSDAEKASPSILAELLSVYQQAMDITLLDQDERDHFLPAVFYLEPEDIKAGGPDYSMREKWLLTLPVYRLSRTANTLHAILKTSFSSPQVDFLLGLPQFDDPDWAERSLRAYYADAGFDARLRYLQEGTSFETPFDGMTMDAENVQDRPALCKLLMQYQEVLIAAFPSGPDYAYGIARNSQGRITISKTLIPLRLTGNGKGLVSTLEGRIAWAKHLANHKTLPAAKDVAISDHTEGGITSHDRNPV